MKLTKTQNRILRWFSNYHLYVRVTIFVVLIVLSVLFDLEHYYPHLITIFVAYLLLEIKIKRTVEIEPVHSRPPEIVLEYLHNSKNNLEEIKILDNSILDLMDARYKGLSFFQIIKNLVQNKRKVKILLLDPNSYAAKQRILIDLPSGSVSFDELKVGISKLFDFWSSLSNTEKDFFELRIFNATPSIVSIKWDKTAFVSFFDPSEKSQTKENLLINYNSKLGDYVDIQFNKIWDDNESINIENYMTLSLVVDFPDKQVEPYNGKPMFFFCGSDNFEYLPRYIAYKPDQNEKLDNFFSCIKERYLTFEILKSKASIYLKREIRKDIHPEEYENILFRLNKKYRSYLDNHSPILFYPLRVYEIEIINEFYPIRCFKKDIARIIEHDKFCFIPSNYFDLNVKLFWEAQTIAQIYSTLGEDEALADVSKKVSEDYGKRFRKIAKFDYDYNSGKLVFVRDGNFKQKRTYKEKHGKYERSAPRKFEIAEEADQNNFVRKLVKFDLENLVSEQNLIGTKWHVQIHFIKMTASFDHPGHPSPEGIHDDNHDYMAMHFVEKKNIISGGQSEIHLSRDGSRLADKYILENFLDTVYLKDRDVFHYTTPFVTDSKDGGHRSIMLVDFDRLT